MVNHYKLAHKILLTTTKLTFVNLETFEAWKLREEGLQSCYFITARSKQITANQTAVMQLRCHRDGKFYKSGKDDDRHRKLQGSNKINGHCPANIDIVIQICGTVEIVYCETHVGHANELSRIPLSKADKQYFAQKIAIKITFDDILDTARKSRQTNKLTRKDLVTRKDLHNIARKCNLKVELIQLHRSGPVTHLACKSIDIDNKPMITYNEEAGHGFIISNIETLTEHKNILVHVVKNSVPTAAPDNNCDDGHDLKINDSYATEHLMWPQYNPVATVINTAKIKDEINNQIATLLEEAEKKQESLEYLQKWVQNGIKNMKAINNCPNNLRPKI